MTDFTPPRATLNTLFEHKAWANEELFAALSAVDAATYPKHVHNVLRILNHVHVVDCIFQAHLEGRSHGYEATNTADTPSVRELAAAARATDIWYRSHVAGLTAPALLEVLQFRFTDGDTGTMTREEMLLHVITHGGYHRGAAGQVMRDAATPPPRDLYTRYLHLTQPLRRG